MHFTGSFACLYVYIYAHCKVIKPDGFTSVSLSTQVKPTPLRPRAEPRAPVCGARLGSEVQRPWRYGGGPTAPGQRAAGRAAARGAQPMPDSPPAFGSGSRRDGRTLPGPRSGTAVPPPAALVTPRSPIPLPLPPSAAADYPGQEARAGGSAATAGSRWRAARALPDSAPCAVPPARPGRHRPHLSSGDRTEPPRTPRPQHLRTCPAALSPPPGAEATPAPAATPRLRLAARPAPRPGRAPPPPRPPAPPAARHGTASLRPRRDSPDGAGLPAPRGLPGWSRAASADRQRDGAAELAPIRRG